MTRFLKIILTVQEEAVGGLLGDLKGRAGINHLDLEVVEIIDGRSKAARAVKANGHDKTDKRQKFDVAHMLRFLAKPRTRAEFRAAYGLTNKQTNILDRLRAKGTIYRHASSGKYKAVVQ